MPEIFYRELVSTACNEYKTVQMDCLKQLTTGQSRGIPPNVFTAVPDISQL
jgi:hypothetical protein